MSWPTRENVEMVRRAYEARASGEKGDEMNPVETNWSLWRLWTLRDGKAVRGQGFTNSAEALEAAGLRE